MEAMTYVRWGATKFVRGQPRFGGENEYDDEAEPDADEWRAKKAFCSDAAERARVTTGLLLDMITKAFPKNISKSNIGAMLKRCAIILNTKTAIYYRPAGIGTEVEKLPLTDGYLNEDAGALLQEFLKNGTQRDAEEYNRVLTFEKRILAEVMPARQTPQMLQPKPEDGAVREPVGAAIPASFAEEDDVFGFGGGLQAPEAYEAAPVPMPVVVSTTPASSRLEKARAQLAKVKREKMGEAPSTVKLEQTEVPAGVFAELRECGGCFEIDSPSPVAKRVKADPDAKAELAESLQAVFEITHQSLVDELAGACISVDDDEVLD